MYTLTPQLLHLNLSDVISTYTYINVVYGYTVDCVKKRDVTMKPRNVVYG